MKTIKTFKEFTNEVVKPFKDNILTCKDCGETDDVHVYDERGKEIPAEDKKYGIELCHDCHSERFPEWYR